MVASPELVERLAGLTRLWGDIKYFHIRLAFEDVDWDGALLDVLPMVLDATNADGYRVAVETMVNTLSDPATTVVDGTAKDPPAGWDGPPTVQVDQPQRGVVHVAVRGTGRWLGAETTSQLREAIGRAAEAGAAILDLRDSGWGAGVGVAPQLSPLLSVEARLPARAVRFHRGHTPVGNDYAYAAAVVYHQSLRVPAGADTAVRLAVVLGADTDIETLALAGGLQWPCGAFIVASGDFSEAACDVNRLPGDIEVHYPVATLVHDDGTTGVEPDLECEGAGIDPVEAACGLLTGRVQPRIRPRPPALSPRPALPALDPCPDERCPPVPVRLLAVCRLWNALRLFYGYPGLLHDPWDEVLADALADALSAENGLAYAKALNRVLVRTRDRHSVLRGGALDDHVGTALPPVAVRLVEGQTVVMHTGEGVDGVAPGDVVVAVDGEPVDERRRELGDLVAASHDAARQVKVHASMLLAGAPDSVCSLEIETASGGRRMVAVRRRASQPLDIPDRLPTFCVLPNGHGYVDLDRLGLGELDEALACISGTPATVFDLRGYPRGTAWALAPRVARRSGRAAEFRTPVHTAERGARFELFYQHVDPAQGDRYEGEIAVLIDESTISQAEHTCLFLEAAAPVTLVGARTAGANGEVRALPLPGGLTAAFACMDVRHGDGRQLQGVGIQPHVAAHPTLAGVRAGRDEVLEAAVAFLDDKLGTAG